MSTKLFTVEGERVEIREPQDRAPEFSDENLALRFADTHKDRLRYVAKWGRWLEWDGNKWKFEDTLHAMDLARAICRSAAAICSKPKIRWQGEGLAQPDIVRQATADYIAAEDALAALAVEWRVDFLKSQVTNVRMNALINRCPATQGLV